MLLLRCFSKVPTQTPTSNDCGIHVLRHTVTVYKNREAFPRAKVHHTLWLKIEESTIIPFLTEELERTADDSENAALRNNLQQAIVAMRDLKHLIMKSGANPAIRELQTYIKKPEEGSMVTSTFGKAVEREDEERRFPRRQFLLSFFSSLVDCTKSAMALCFTISCAPQPRPPIRDQQDPEALLNSKKVARDYPGTVAKIIPPTASQQYCEHVADVAYNSIYAMIQTHEIGSSWKAQMPDNPRQFLNSVMSTVLESHLKNIVKSIVLALDGRFLDGHLNTNLAIIYKYLEDHCSKACDVVNNGWKSPFL